MAESGHDIGLPADIAFLANAGISRCTLTQAAKLCRSKNIAASEILIARKKITREQYLSRLADHIGARFHDGALDPKAIVLPVDPGRPSVAAWVLPRVAILLEDGTHRLVIAPVGGDAERVAKILERNVDRPRPITIVMPQRLRAALFARLQAQIERQARYFLATHHPKFSARRRSSRGQRWVSAVTGAGLAAAFAAAPGIATLYCTAVTSLAYLIIITFRAWLIVCMERGQANRTWPAEIRNACTEDYPVYSVLVPLYREENQVQALVEALDRLKWPRRKREIFLICESGDEATISAIRARDLPDGFRLVICPDCKPKTKPKALNFAIPLCTGRFLVIYDAEDRPHPDQLLEAWGNFRQADPALACLQSPLAASNPRQNWLSGMFAIEYDVLFRGTLPASENFTSLLPLGGTSNHFRSDALRAVGAWDPYNVTEDADLGIRLARCGFRSGVLALPTIGEAPPILRIWLGQRTRWIKGWMQTALVHTRNPVRLTGDLGWRNTMFMHFFVTAFLISVLFHTLFLLLAAFHTAMLLAGHVLSNVDLALLGLCTFNLVGGYTTYGFMALAVRRSCGLKKPPAWILLTLPLYWLLMSIAGWAAFWQLIRRPFHWEKTEHGLANSGNHGNIREGGRGPARPEKRRVSS